MPRLLHLKQLWTSSWRPSWNRQSQVDAFFPFLFLLRGRFLFLSSTRTNTDAASGAITLLRIAEVDEIPEVSELQVHLALSVAAAGACATPIARLNYVRLGLQDVEVALANMPAKKTLTNVRGRLLNQRSKFQAESAALEKDVAGFSHRSLTIDIANAAALSVPAQAVARQYTDLTERLQREHPEAFIMLKQAEQTFNRACGTIEIGSTCEWLSDRTADSIPCKVVAPGHDAATNKVTVCLWYEEHMGVKDYAEGYTKAATVDRAELCGCLAPFLQPLPADAVETHEQCIALRKLGGRHYARLCKLLNAELASWLKRGGFPPGAAKLICPPIKGLESMVRKVMSKYKGNFAKLLDVCRFTVECKTMDVLAAVAAGLVSGTTELRMIRLKNRLDPRRTTFAGYRDILTNMELVDAKFACEVQVSLKPYLALKSASHEVYDGARISTLSSTYLGNISKNCIVQLGAGAIQECDNAGTMFGEDQLVDFKAAIAGDCSRLTTLVMDGCEYLKGKNLEQDLLTPAVCKGLGNIIGTISLNGCGFVGGLLNVVQNLVKYCSKSVEHLDFGGGGKDVGMTGSIPWGEISKLEQLKLFDVFGNRLEGELPTNLGELLPPNLEDLYINWNAGLTGAIPEGAFVAGNRLKRLKFNNCSFAGQLPRSVGNLAHVESFGANHNKLSGTIPKEFMHCSKLFFLNLGNNEIGGAIPPELGSMASLGLLWLGWNCLEGAIPRSLGNIKTLKSLKLNGNALVGTIPAELCNLKNLAVLELWSNRLSGSIPLVLATCLPNLSSLGIVAMEDEDGEKDFNEFTNLEEFQTILIETNPRIKTSGTARNFKTDNRWGSKHRSRSLVVPYVH